MNAIVQFFKRIFTPMPATAQPVTPTPVKSKIGTLWADFVARTRSVMHDVEAASGKVVVDAEKVAPLAEDVMAIVAPEDLAALTVVTKIIEIVDDEITKQPLPAPATVTIPQSLVETFSKAKATVIAAASKV